jgi:hypothetical protein
MEHDIAKLEKRIRAFDEKKHHLESLDSLLGAIIHRPGWTSIAESALVNLALDTLESHADSIAQIQKQLVQAAGQVGAVDQHKAA